MAINWKVTARDAALIKRITDRAMKMFKEDSVEADALDTQTDIACCHLNACRLRLADWLAADDFSFAHDLCCIRNCLNRRTGKLDGRFLPRFAAKGATP